MVSAATLCSKIKYHNNFTRAVKRSADDATSIYQRFKLMIHLHNMSPLHRSPGKMYLHKALQWKGLFLGRSSQVKKKNKQKNKAAFYHLGASLTSCLQLSMSLKCCKIRTVTVAINDSKPPCSFFWLVLKMASITGKYHVTETETRAYIAASLRRASKFSRRGKPRLSCGKRSPLFISISTSL